MAYSLRVLPPDAVALIDEMRRHWLDLAGLRAAGGTPSARCLKAFEITQTGDGVRVEARAPPDHLRLPRDDGGCYGCAKEGSLCSFCRERPYRTTMIECPLRVWVYDNAERFE